MNRIHGAFSDEPSLALWILHAFFSPLRGGFIALAYALDGQTVRRLLHNRLAIFQRRKSHVMEYPAARGHSDSFVTNRNRNQPNTNSTENTSSEGGLEPECIALSGVQENGNNERGSRPVGNGDI